MSTLEDVGFEAKFKFPLLNLVTLLSVCLSILSCELQTQLHMCHKKKKHTNMVNEKKTKGGSASLIC